MLLEAVWLSALRVATDGAGSANAAIVVVVVVASSADHRSNNVLVFVCICKLLANSSISCSKLFQIRSNKFN